jgi:hypothetical protein
VLRDILRRRTRSTIFVILAVGGLNERWRSTNLVKIQYLYQYVYTGVTNGLVLLLSAEDLLGCSLSVGM